MRNVAAFRSSIAAALIMVTRALLAPAPAALAHPAPAQSMPAPNAPGGTAPAAGANPYAIAADCGTCHQAIYRYWSDSPHARAATGPVYLAALEAVVGGATDKAAARRQCVWCHAPTALTTGDWELQAPISRDGITCDFCHTVESVVLDKDDNPFVLVPGNVKFGPYEYAKSVGHETSYSPLHRASPLLCASCHEYTNARGVAVLSNYSEWKAGPYPARGVSCQDCHMALVPGATAKDSVKGDTLRVVNLHRLVGGSARGQLDRGLDLKIESVTRAGGTASVLVTVKNVAAGHAVPGGLSTKSLILAIGTQSRDGRFEHRQERVYRRDLKDAQGQVIKGVAGLFLQAASVGLDNRIKPLETRSERFEVPIPEGSIAISARLEYRDASDPSAEPSVLLITEKAWELSKR